MIDYELFNLYEQTSIKKEIQIYYDRELIIDNSKIYDGQFTISESICSDKNFRFGLCEASALNFSVTNDVGSLSNLEIEVKQILDGNKDKPFRIGTYVVFSDRPSATRNYRNVTAYDYMTHVLTADVSAWYKGLFANGDEEYTLKEFRDSFFEYLGISQTNTALPNDAMIVRKTIDNTYIKGKYIINCICEINACFGHMNRNNEFEYIFIDGSKSPSDAYEFVNTFDCDCEDHSITRPTQLVIKENSSDVGLKYGDDDVNPYTICANFLLFKQSKNELDAIAKNFLDKCENIGVYDFAPINAIVYGNPCVEVGDFIKINTRDGYRYTYILQRYLTGIQSLRDKIITKGNELFQFVPVMDDEMYFLQGKSNTFERDLELTRSLIKDVSNDLSSKIEQTAEKVETAVIKGENYNGVVIDENGVSVNGDGAFIVNMTNFKLYENGNTDIKGKMHATVLDIEDINSDKEYKSSMKMDDSRAVLRVTNENFLDQNNNTEYDAEIIYGISNDSSNSRIINSFYDRNTDLAIDAEIEMSANEKKSLIQIRATNQNTNLNPLIQLYSDVNSALISIGVGRQILTLYQRPNGNGYISLASNGKYLYLDGETIPHFTGTKSNIQEQIDNLSSVIGGITYDADTETIVVSDAMTGIYYDDETIYL